MSDWDDDDYEQGLKVREINIDEALDAISFGEPEVQKPKPKAPPRRPPKPIWGYGKEETSTPAPEKAQSSPGWHKFCYKRETR